MDGIKPFPSGFTFFSSVKQKSFSSGLSHSVFVWKWNFSSLDVFCCGLHLQRTPCEAQLHASVVTFDSCALKPTRSTTRSSSTQVEQPLTRFISRWSCLFRNKTGLRKDLSWIRHWAPEVRCSRLPAGLKSINLCGRHECEQVLIDSLGPQSRCTLSDWFFSHHTPPEHPRH